MLAMYSFWFLVLVRMIMHNKGFKASYLSRMDLNATNTPPLDNQNRYLQPTNHLELTQIQRPTDPDQAALLNMQCELIRLVPRWTQQKNRINIEAWEDLRSLEAETNNKLFSE